jgi:uncharacterized protein YgfB (UPF0149 family)
MARPLTVAGRSGATRPAGQQCETELADPELGFEPLLPEDDRPLTERAEAMVDWCRGFLGGFGLAGTGARQLSDEAQEILRDLGTIAASSFDFGNEDEDEDALIEVQEFVRIGAMLLFTECTAHGKPGSGTCIDSTAPALHWLSRPRNSHAVAAS